MAIELVVTPDMAAFTGRTSLYWSPGTGGPGQAVVLASAAAARAASEGERGCGVWIVVGEDGLPDRWQPFLALPESSSEQAIERAIAAGLEVLTLRRQVADHRRDAEVAQVRQLDLVRVGIALTAERDLNSLLQLILTTSRELVRADAGSLYLIEEHDERRLLRFVLAQNDSVPLSLSTATVPLDPTSLAGYVAVSGEPVSLPDVRKIPADVPYRFNASFDSTIGYHTRAVLTAPISTRAGEVIGVLQLINRRLEQGVRIINAATADQVVLQFGPEEVALIQALAAQAAVAIENTRLVQEIERLFEGFVRASVGAIEQRDPTTSGHSLRVAQYVLALARAVELQPPPTFSRVSFSRDEITQLRYAALLHDFGKVGVRESVLTKGKKLFPERLALVEERFRHARRAREVAVLRQFLARLLELGRAPSSDDWAALEAAVRQSSAELDGYFATILTANEPSVLDQETGHLLTDLRGARFPGSDGHEVQLLFPEEMRALSVVRGSLDEAERLEIESHVVHSFEFLLKIPWPKRYRRVPEIAYGHHEKLDGRGYPNHLLLEDIPLEARMMTVCDIYDALTAGDRPYKRAVSHERALAILEDEGRSGAIDPELVQLARVAGVFIRRHDEPLAI